MASDADLANLVDSELARPWWAAASPQLRHLYNKRRTLHRRRDARFSMWAAVVIYVLFLGLDAVLLPDVAGLTLFVRVGLGLLALATVEGMWRLRVDAERFDAVCAGIVVVCYLGWLGVAISSAQALSVSYYMIFGTIFVMVACLFFNFKPRTANTASILMVLAFFAAIFSLTTVSIPYVMAFGTFYVSCFALNAYVNMKLNIERYNVFLNALKAEIREDEVLQRSRELFRLSNTDPLTGLENRRSIDEKLRHLWNDWKTHGAPFSAILIDIDFFKSYNDYYGHQEGDRCLLRVGETLAGTIKPYGASLGRYGGEEFIVLARVANTDELDALAELIRLAVVTLALPHQHRRDGEDVVTASVGASLTRPQNGAKLERLINEADRALYAAKASGRNCVRLFDPGDPQGNDDSENIAALLRIAVAQDLVSLAYQPIQNVATGRMDAAEALMRLRMLDGTSVPPSVFIPIAERTGAILELGRWAVRTVCREILCDDRIPVVSVNVSAVQLRAPGFSASIAAILGETNVEGNRLAFEITEGLELEINSGVLRCIAELKQLGIRIWLDDFGTGFAGLSWLRLIDFDTVKIDRSFLADCATPQGAAMMQDIIALVRNRSKQILVEGVEHPWQLALMREYRIDQIQGYLIGRPTSPEKIRPPTLRRPEGRTALRSA